MAEEQQQTYLDESGNPKVTYLNEKGEPLQDESTIGKIIKSVKENPTAQKVGRWLLTGDPREPDPNRAPTITGMEGSLLPSLQHPQDEGWMGYLARGAYNTLIQPLGSAPGIIGASQPKMSDVLLEQRLANIGKQIVDPLPEIPSAPLPEMTGKPKLSLEPKPPEEITNLRNQLVNKAPTSEVPEVAPNIPEKIRPLNELANVTKSMMASMDISAPLRQGLPLIHRKEWWSSLDDMMKSLVSEKNYTTLMQTIESKPTYDLAKKSGLSLTSLDNILSREEAYMSKWAEKIPGVRASERAYVGFLNKLRSDTFDSLITSAEKSGRELTPELTRSIAKYINTSTGRGSLGSLEKAAVELNYVFFSPRMISSRLTMMNPAYYIKADPFVRKEALKSLFALAAAGETVSELGRLAGGTVNNDPTNPDFQKVKIGNTRLDPYGGFQQYIVAASRLMSGKSTSSTSGKTWTMGENFVAPTRLSTVANFARSKLSPVASFAADLLQGKDFSGQPINVPKEIADRFTPMLIQDIIGLAKEDPSLLPLGIPAALGMGLQSYNK